MREITRKLKRDFLILSAKINPSESFRKSLLFFVILSFVSNAKYHVFIFAQGPQEVSNPRGHNSLSAATAGGTLISRWKRRIILKIHRNRCFTADELRGFRWLSDGLDSSLESCNISPESFQWGLFLHRERQSIEDLSGTASSDKKSKHHSLALPPGIFRGGVLAAEQTKIGHPKFLTIVFRRKSSSK